MANAKNTAAKVSKFESIITKDQKEINAELIQEKVEDKLIQLDNDIAEAKKNVREAKKAQSRAEADFHGTTVLKARLAVDNAEKTLEGLRGLKEEFFSGVEI